MYFSDNEIYYNRMLERWAVVCNWWLIIAPKSWLHMLDKDSVGKLHSHLSVAAAIMLTNERLHFKEEGRGEREKER